MRIPCLTRQQGYLNHSESNKVFKGTVVNRTCPPFNGELVQITCIVPLIKFLFSCLKHSQKGKDYTPETQVFYLISLQLVAVNL